jgi:hypothetical protein
MSDSQSEIHSNAARLARKCNHQVEIDGPITGGFESNDNDLADVYGKGTILIDGERVTWSRSPGNTRQFNAYSAQTKVAVKDWTNRQDAEVIRLAIVEALYDSPELPFRSHGSIHTRREIDCMPEKERTTEPKQQSGGEDDDLNLIIGGSS